MRSLRLAAIVGLVVTAVVPVTAQTGKMPVVGQKAKSATKKNWPPPAKIQEEYEAIDPLVLESSGCVDDFIKMRSLAGVAQRKLLADLFDTGCAVPLDGIFRVIVIRHEVYKGFIHALVLLDVEKMKAILPQKLDELIEADIRRTEASEKISVGNNPLQQDDVYVELAKCATLSQFAEATKGLEEQHEEQKDR